MLASVCATSSAELATILPEVFRWRLKRCSCPEFQRVQICFLVPISWLQAAAEAKRMFGRDQQGEAAQVAHEGKRSKGPSFVAWVGSQKFRKVHPNQGLTGQSLKLLLDFL